MNQTKRERVRSVSSYKLTDGLFVVPGENYRGFKFFNGRIRESY